MLKISAYRKAENLHIYLWLIKDFLWAYKLVIPAMCMIVPTLFVAVWLLIKNRYHRTDLVHNTAVLFWLCANVTWMTSEFFAWETSLKTVILVLFMMGIALLTFYYIYLFVTATKTNQPEK